MLCDILLRGRGSRKYIRCFALLGILCMVIILLLRRSSSRRNPGGKTVKLIKDPESYPTQWKYMFNDELLVFSAFSVDARTNDPYIRAFGLISNKFDDLSPYYCVVNYRQNGKFCPTKRQRLKMQEIDSENRGWAFFPVSLKCPFARGMDPVSITIIKDLNDCREKDNLAWVKVTETEARTDVKLKDFGLCILPPEGFESVGQILEVMELNRILGADLILLYDQAWRKTDQIVLALQHYLKSGILDIVDWHLPLDAHDKFHRHGQTVFLNDCLYRLKNKVKYVVYTDVDEFLVPLKHSDWPSMMAYLEPTNKHVASYRVDDLYMLVKDPADRWRCKDETGIEKLTFESEDVCPMVLSHTLVLQSKFSYPSHSRCILRPDKVNLVTVDKSIETIPGFTDKTLSRDLVVSFHYIDEEEAKWWLGDESLISAKKYMYMFEYKEELIASIKENLKHWDT
ncbi:beta-1,4-galactosyltransferase galt-1-like [Tubulanus polymorphus]|uniref:beta-1,4-galactosyltransferase galt-1-like n=1 Tax=Tubulanus polymorphus TaxID=672921 RepID=UPI003DA63C64